MRRRPLALATTLALATMVALTAVDASAADEVVSVEAFLARVGDARALALVGSSDPSGGAMRDVRAALGLPVIVEISGTSVRIETDPFLARLDGSVAADFDQAVAHLDAVAATVREAEGATPPDPAAVHDAVRRAFIGVARPTSVDALRAYVYAAIAKILRLVFEPLREFRGVRSVVAWAVVAALLAGVVLLLRRQGLGLVPDRSTGRARGSRDIDWDRVAEEALRRGDLREATRALYHVLQRGLALRGIVPSGTSTTAGECRAAVAAKLPGVYDEIARGTNAFERVAYGGASASPEDVEALRDAARRVAA